MKDVSKYEEEVELKTGECIHVRAIRPTDKEGLLGLFRALSPQSVYSRFLYRKKDVSPQQLAYFTELDFDSHVGLVATVVKDQAEEIVGVGRYIVDDANASPRSAEVAFAVADAHQGHGIGQVLLTRLATIGAAAGVGKFAATADQNDKALLSLLEHSGFEAEERRDFGRVQVSLSLKAVKK